MLFRQILQQNAQQADLVTDNDRWCDVNWRSMESVKYPGVYVLGDATLALKRCQSLRIWQTSILK